MSATSNDGLPPDLIDEITSINSIYDSSILVRESSVSNDAASVVLTLPQTPVSLLLDFPPSYPATSPTIRAVNHVDASLTKGIGSTILEIARHVLAELTSDPSHAGEVVIYELIELLEARIADSVSVTDADAEYLPREPTQHPRDSQNGGPQPPVVAFIPNWTMSEPLISHKSTFLARACAISSPDEAHNAVHHLVSTDKKVAKATHNMWAYRIRGNTTQAKAQAEIVYSDADDDGEDGAGAKLAALLQSMGARGVLVVVSRWYGGIKLGPERWRLIGSVGREALVKGGEKGHWKLDRA